MNKAMQVIETALAGVRDELAKHQTGSGTVSTPDQLRHFEVVLEGMLEDLRQDRFDDERIGLGHAVVDSWPLDHDLTNRICAAVQAYKKLIAQRDQPLPPAEGAETGP